ncbi:PREDICTED: early endosome antigen 1 [Nelumbo nucifera]|uniref:C2 NT-type domain-containing protein n=2 Tax=Nelumbo nucifera TaxID=4432 RepID=A0A822ZX40_NELNU|nr:PREDICTED: early endosome antigen 1 [Nelumbo nucifera]DAD47426.1 TPA_asm: hypothetical protein HUJ06_017363 [Nelumbo nucifera]
MFKSARWRSDKNKIKAVFKLQFQATQVPLVGWETLIVSLVPVDVGKPTVKLEKTAVRDGTCRWENPIYETIKFVRETKTGKINEKVYHCLVSTGSSKAGLLGEVSIDFANYAEAIKPFSISLPLKSSNSGAVLHVTIQRIQGNVDRREVGENGDVTVKFQDRSLRSQMSNSDIDESDSNDATENGPLNKIASQNAQAKRNPRSSIGFDVMTGPGSDSSSGRNTPRELGLKNNNAHQNPRSYLSSLSHSTMPQKPMVNATTTNYNVHQRSNTEWSMSSAPDGSLDGSTSSSEDTLLKESLSQASDVSIEKLKSDLFVLTRQAEVSELELQTLRKQIVKESKRGQELSREVIGLKEERDALKKECEQLKASQHIEDTKTSNKLQFESKDPWALLEEIRQELNYEKDINANLRLQLQKTQESNSELILAVQDLDEMLEQKNKEISHLSYENADKVQEAFPKHQIDEEKEEEALELIANGHDDAKETHLLEQKIIDLYSEIEMYRKEREELEMQTEQLALDYEILKQENHDMSAKLEQNQLQEQLKTQYEISVSLASITELESQVESLEKQLKEQAQEFSTSLTTINELKTQVKHLEKEIEKQAQGFEADLEVVTRAKVEQEQRAIRAEEALRQTRWKNANTAERLQEEFKKLSTQMMSTFDANEKLAMKALTEASELRLQKSHLEEMLEKANEELVLVKDQYEAKLLNLSNQIDSKIMEAKNLFSELEDKSMKLEHQKNSEEEKVEALKKEILMLKVQVEELTQEKNNLSKQAEQKEQLIAEIEELKTSVSKMEKLVEKGNMERDELKRRVASLMEEADNSLEELNSLRHLKDEKDTLIGILQSEVETSQAQYNDLKQSLFEDELEKENLRKQVFHLKGDLKKKEDSITVMEKKLKDGTVQVTGLEGTKQTLRNNKSGPVSRGSKEVASLREKIKLLEGQIKLKEAALESSANSFLQKEKDLCTRIDELENRVEELNQNSTRIFEDQFQKEAKGTEKINGDATNFEELRNEENLLDSEKCSKAYISVQCDNEREHIRSSSGTFLEKELKVSTSHTNDQENLVELLSEMASLKEKNKFMEDELKEMQERYSAISLKFAEVEGERQQLVMTVRNLKNARKN